VNHLQIPPKSIAKKKSSHALNNSNATRKEKAQLSKSRKSSRLANANQTDPIMPTSDEVHFNQSSVGSEFRACMTRCCVKT
jgi:hypothetical protein